MTPQVQASRALALIAADMGLDDQDTAIALMAAALDVLSASVGADRAFDAAAVVLAAAGAQWAVDHAN